MTDPNDSITVTREELEREIFRWLGHMGIGSLVHDGRKDFASYFTDTLFTNAKAREEVSNESS